MLAGKHISALNSSVYFNRQIVQIFLPDKFNEYPYLLDRADCGMKKRCDAKCA